MILGLKNLIATKKYIHPEIVSNNFSSRYNASSHLLLLVVKTLLFKSILRDCRNIKRDFRFKELNCKEKIFVP